MGKTRNHNTKIIIISIVALVVLATAFFAVYQLLRPKGVEGTKTFHLNVIVNNETIKSGYFRTDEEYLRQALEEEDLIKGNEGTYGLWITTVAGRTADSDKEEWWGIYKNGEMSMTGVDDTADEDGDVSSSELMSVSEVASDNNTDGLRRLKTQGQCCLLAVCAPLCLSNSCNWQGLPNIELVSPAVICICLYFPI